MAQDSPSEEITGLPRYGCRRIRIIARAPRRAGQKPSALHTVHVIAFILLLSSRLRFFKIQGVYLLRTHVAHDEWIAIRREAEPRKIAP